MTARPQRAGCDKVRLIPLRARDGTVRAHAQVDDQDYQRLGSLRWSLHPLGYAVRRERRSERPGGGRRGLVYLHREVLNVGRGEKKSVDHKNRDGLDCRRENLRLLDQGLNAFANIQRWESERQGSPPIDDPQEETP